MEGSGILGTCGYMCPQKEQLMRTKVNRIHFFERRLNNQNNLLVKEFIRVGSGNKVHPSDLRPPNVLLDTTYYLINNIVPQKPFYEAYNFAFDRMRAIRQDLTIQKIEGNCAIKIYEIITRFLTYSAYMLCEEDYEKFCATTNMKHLQECLSKLFALYDGSDSSNEAEFLSYHLLVCFGSSEVILHALSKKHLRHDRMVNIALTMNMSWIRKNYTKVFKLARHLTPLQACAFHWKLNNIRVALLQVLSAAYSVKNVTFPLEALSEMMLFQESLERQHVLKLLSARGIVVVDDQISFCNKAFPLLVSEQEHHRSFWIDSLFKNVTSLKGLLIGDSCGQLEGIIKSLKI